MPSKITQPVKPIRKSLGETFLPLEIVDRVEHLFLNLDLNGPTVEKRLGIRRGLLERALKHAIRNPSGPSGMQRARSITGSQPFVVQRRMA